MSRMTAWSQGGAAFNQPQQIKLKAWATDGFISEFCDAIADDLTISYDTAETYRQYVNVVNHLYFLSTGIKTKEKKEEAKKQDAGGAARRRVGFGGFMSTGIGFGNTGPVVRKEDDEAAEAARIAKEEEDRRKAEEEEERQAEADREEPKLPPGPLRDKVGPVLKQMKKALARTELFFKKFEGYQKWKMQYYVSKMVDDVAKAVDNMKEVGQFCIFPILVPETHDTGITLVVEYLTNKTVRCTVINPNPLTSFHPQKVGAENPSKIKQMIAMTFSDVPTRKIKSESWWSMVMLGSRILTQENVFYTHFCSWLTGKPHVSHIVEYADRAYYATPAKSGYTVLWKSLVHALKYVLRVGGVEESDVKLVRHHVKRFMLDQAVKDLDTVDSIKFSTKQLVATAARNTAASLARNAAKMQAAEVTEARAIIEGLSTRLEHTYCDDDGTTLAPALLDVTNGWSRVQQPDSMPLMECFRRLESVDQFAGAAIEQTRLVPANFLRVRAKAKTFDEALEVINESVTLIIRICASMGMVKNIALLTLSLIAEVALEVLPHPLGPKSRMSQPCIWSNTPMRYGQQLHLLKRLHELTEFYMNAIMSCDHQHDYDATRITVVGVFAAIADAVIRVRPTDKVGLFTQHYQGYKNKDKFCVTAGKYSEQTEKLQVLYAEALIARTHILDYFDEASEDVPAPNVIWAWELQNGTGREDKANNALMRQLAHAEALRTSGVPAALISTVNEGYLSQLTRQYTEVCYFRNIVFYFKHLMNSSFIHKTEWLYNVWPDSLRWEWTGEGYRVYGFDGSQLSTEARIRHRSYGDAQMFTAPYEVVCENDVLHIKNLPTFEDVMGQRDSELLLSYLTVPYIRIPLILRFFATEDRVSCLRSTQVQSILSAVVFECGRFLPYKLSGICPEMVPSEKQELVAAPYGALINELLNSTQGVVAPVIRLMELASELDAGTVYNETTTNVILFLVRMVARVQNYVSLALDMLEGNVNGKLRDVFPTKEAKQELLLAQSQLKEVITSKIFPMIETWINEAMAKAVEAQQTDDIDRATALASRLHSHIVQLLRNVKEENFDDAYVSQLLSSFTFLTTRYTWSTSALPEIELYSIIHRQRRSVVRYLSKASPASLSKVMDGVVRIVTSASKREEDRHNQWGFVAGTDCVGRYARLDEELLAREGREKGAPELLASLKQCLGVDTLPAGSQTVAEGLQDVELNIQTLSLTFKAAHLRALPGDIANDANVFSVFGPLVGNKVKMLQTMQCAVVEDAVNRTWVRLVGQEHDIQFWKTADPRFPIPDDKMMRYFPEDLTETEKWIYDVFEPIRKAYFERNFWDPPIFILLPEQKLTADNSVAMLQAIDSQTGRKLKELFVFRDFRCVNSYDVLSYGRRYYRRLVYTSNNRFCHLQLHPSTDRRNRPLARWARHAAGDPDPDSSTEHATSAVIIRHASHPDNVSGSAETFVPVYLLNGLVPSCLQETHRFWQDEDDNIRGYPIYDKDDKTATKPNHILWLHWRELQFDPLNTRNTTVRIFRFPRVSAAPRASDEAVARSQFVKTAAEGGDAADGETIKRSPSYDAAAAELEAGLYKESEQPLDTSKAATIEDHQLMLINLLYAREGTPLYSLATVLTRIELLSHILVWTTKTDYAGTGPLTIDLIQLPRLKLSFAAKLSPDGSEYLLYSLDHSHLFVSNLRPALVTNLIQGVPHSLLLQDTNGSMSVLVPSLNLARPQITTAPFSTELVLNRSDANWYLKLDTRYYLYPVHVSLSFMFTPTLASALYLLLLRFYHRDYADVFRLAGTIGTDMELTPEEHQIFSKLGYIIDSHPNAHACRAKISLLVTDSPVALGWYAPQEVAYMISKSNEVQVACRLTQNEEKRLLYVCDMTMRKMDIIRDFCKDEENKEGANLVFQKLGDRSKVIDGTIQQRKLVRAFYAGLMTKLREILDVRISKDDLNRLLAMFQTFAQKPLTEYWRCLILNRRAIIEAETKNPGKVSAEVELRVPKLGKDLLWLFYRDFSALSTKPPGSAGKPNNDEGRTVAMSKSWDYYYCGASGIRKANSCRCKGCNDTCGPNTGCPCLSCEKYNDTEGCTVRELIPTFDAGKSTKAISFFDAFIWINDALNRWQNWRRDEKYPYTERSVPLSLRDTQNSFLRYYELLTSTTKLKISQQDSSKDFAELMFHFSRDARMPASGLGHMMHFLISTPPCWPKLLKFNRTSKQKLDQKTVAIYSSIWAQASAYREGPPSIDDLPKFENPELFKRVIALRRSERTADVPLNLTTILPTPANTDCTSRKLEAPNLKFLRTQGNEMDIIAVSEETLKELSGLPLGPAIADDSYAVMMIRKEVGLPEVSPQLPFDLKGHEDATKTVARDMLSRLETDMKDFAAQANADPQPKFVGYATREEAQALWTGKPTQKLAALRNKLTKLCDHLQAMREKDSRYLGFAMPIITRTANHIDLGGDLGSTLVFLRRFAGKEATLNIDYLIASLCSSTGAKEWQQLNPYLTHDTSLAIFNLITVTVLRANRIGHCNRASEMAKDLLSLLDRADNFPESLTTDAQRHHFVDANIASSLQKADSLAAQLLTPRVYVKADRTFDPRFMLFEFTWNLVLRDRQQTLIYDMYNSVSNNESIVKQMIMGAGKTTVVGPLLALMLADGNNLVIQVVPPALLDFTRSVLRTSFSSVLQKQIFTFACDRAAEVDSEALSKFEHAKQSRGIVVTTPSAIKSVFLKYVEGLDRLVDESRQRTVEMEKEAADILGVLTMWRKSVLIMDEVDMLLHPLKSELNFPIGQKHDIDFTPTRWKMPIHIIDAIFYHHSKRVTTNMKESPEAFGILQEFKEQVTKGLEAHALQEMPHLTLLNVEFYEQALKPILARWTLLFLKAQHLVGLTDEETVRYMLKRPTAKDEPAFLKRVQALEEDHIKMLNLAFEWLNCYVPHIMQKIDRVSFGIMNEDDLRRAREEHANMPRSRFVTAIPFIGKDLPSQSSEFAHPDIVIGLTILAYRYEGLRNSDFTDIMSSILASVEKEVGRFSQRRTNLMFVKWVQSAGGKLLASYNYKKKSTAAEDELGMQPTESIVYGEDGEALQKVEVLPLKLLRQANQDEISKIFKLFRRTPEVIHWFLCETIFPEFMRHQNSKLSASGQELGGTMIFERRIGFSGTPSDLLPVELGKCEYERGTDGQLIYTLTNPSVMSLTVVDSGWTVRTVLDAIANASPPYNALIDTGALITGMSNLQVAQYLLKNGLPTMEGVVFLDEFDRKMILVRATGRVLKLAECGIPKVKRFAFYDQVHTTGMDIEHTPNAVAVQTLGKDMTFRDFSQGAYRMRGIGQGQTVRLLIIPEVYDLILRTLRTIRAKDQVIASSALQRSVSDVLRDVTAWLLVNSIRSEHTQHNQLCLQNCANVWRKEAFETLATCIGEFKFTGKPSEVALKALEVYREPVTFAISSSVPQPRMFSEAVKAYIDANQHLINSKTGRAVVDAIIDQTKREDEVDNPTVDVQMVQEQEEERETEQEQEKEQEIEIEKFVDLAYSRDEEVSTSWRLDTLTDPARAVQFYKLSDFHLYKRRPIDFPDSIFLSRNYFNIKWAGHRRMKNVIVTLEWVPDTNQLALRDLPALDYAGISHERGRGMLTTTLNVARKHQSGLSTDLVSDLLSTALHTDKKHMSFPPELLREASERVVAAKEKDAEAFYEEVIGNKVRKEQHGRFTVAVTLEEAETLRRVIHLRTGQRSIVPSSNTAIALNIVPSVNQVLDQSSGFTAAPTPYQSWRNYQCLRFFDSDLHYSDAEFGLLLRALHSNEPKSRQAFFSQVISTRRRARQRWERTPIALLFFMENAFTLLHQRVVGLCVRHELERIKLHLGDAFIAFNNSHSGMLSPDEVWGGLRFCRLDDLTADDVLDFIDVADTTHEGNVQYQDFICALTGDRELADELDTDQPNNNDAQGKKLPTVPPHGTEVLKELKGQRVARQRAAEKEANKELESENQRVMEEIENEQIAQDIADVQASGNPLLEETAMTFSFGHPSLPKLIAPVGVGKVRRFLDDGADCVRMESASSLRSNLRLLKRIRKGDVTMKSYVLSFEFRLPHATHGDTKTPLLKLFERMGKSLVLARWTLPMYRFGGYGSAGIPPFENEIFGNPSTDKGTGTNTGNDRKTETLHIFPEPRPNRDPDAALGVIAQGEFVRTDGQKTNNAIDGITYEWMHILEPKDGWIVREKSGRSMWEQISTTIRFNADSSLVVDHTSVSAAINEVVGVIEDMEEISPEEANKKPEEEEDDGGQIGLTTDVGDLLEALRRAKRLKPGDKVSRNPDEWDHGNDDGGRGTVGKVLRVENERVQIQWPSGHKGTYAWGEAGKFELIKVGEAEEGEDGEERETLNDERWIAELRRGGAKCGACNATKLEPGNWFRCNHCESFTLCKKCFRGGQHSEHDFTDMGALNSAQAEELGPGSHVKIKLSVTNPKYGWQGAKAGMIGVVIDVDRDDNSATVELTDGGVEWKADIAELEQIAAPKEDQEETATVTLTAFNFLTSLEFPPNQLPFLESLVAGAKALSTHEYKMGDRVVTNYGGQGVPGEIRALLPNKSYAIALENGYGYQSGIVESNVKPFPFRVGDRVRVKRNIDGVNFGFVIPFEQRHRLVGKICNIRPYHGNAVRLDADYDNIGRQTFLHTEVDLVGNGRWLLQRTDTDDGNPSEFAYVPTSSNVLIERYFQDGSQTFEVFIRDDTYSVDLVTNQVKRGNRLVGSLKRDPPEEFIKGEEKKQVDDTFPHIISIYVKNGVTSVVCDGKPLQVTFTGVLQSIKDKSKREEQINMAMYLSSTTPLNFMISDVSADVARQTLQFLGPTFPSRILTWMRLDWTPEVTVEDIFAWHVAVNDYYSWTCRDCKALNTRHTDVCAECKAPRIARKSKEDGKQGKFRAALPRSRESQAVRQKLQGKLRMQYQKQLDVLDEGGDAVAGGSLARRGRDVAGPRLPGAASV